LNQVSRESGEFTRDGAGKGESSRAVLAPVLDAALWLLIGLRMSEKLILSLFHSSIWSTPPCIALSDCRMRGGAFVVWS